MQRSWAIRPHEGRHAYPEELRRRIVEALERGMTKVEAVGAFSVGGLLSSLKRYVAISRQGR